MRTRRNLLVYTPRPMNRVRILSHSTKGICIRPSLLSSSRIRAPDRDVLQDLMHVAPSHQSSVSAVKPGSAASRTKDARGPVPFDRGRRRGRRLDLLHQLVPGLEARSGVGGGRAGDVDVVEKGKDGVHDGAGHFVDVVGACDAFVQWICPMVRRRATCRRSSRCSPCGGPGRLVRAASPPSCWPDRHRCRGRCSRTLQSESRRQSHSIVRPARRRRRCATPRQHSLSDDARPH